jgi:hypothetical protein
LDEVDARVDRAHEGDKFVVDDLDHHFAGAERLDDFLANRFFDNGFGEILDDFEVHIGFKQGRADFAHGFANILFADSAPARKRAEHAGEFVS